MSKHKQVPLLELLTAPSERSCGSCSMCCKVPRIDDPEELGFKPAGQWCIHCKPGRGGCGIYDTRPTGCATYRCLWHLSAVPEWFFPARAKFVMDFDIVGEGGLRVKVNVDPSYPNAWREEPYYSKLKELAGAYWRENAVPIVVFVGEESFLLTDFGPLSWDKVERAQEAMRRKAGRAMTRRTVRHRLLDLKTIVARAVPCDPLAGMRFHYGPEQYRLTVSFPLDLETMIEQTEEVETLVGVGCDHAGTDFGNRDVEFDFETRERCAAAAERVRAAKPDYEIHIRMLGEIAQ